MAGFFDRIAVPRIAGSQPLTGVESAITARLEQLGYSVELQRFKTSPRALTAVALFGAACGWVALTLAPFLVVDLPGWPILLTGLAAYALAAFLAVGIAGGMIPLSTAEVEAANVWARRGCSPKFWLVAHSDSKGQGLSLAGRVLAVGVLGSGLALFTIALAARAFTPLPWWAAVAPVLLTAVGGAVLSRGAVSNDSPGAVDNATGVIAALVAAERLSNRDDVGVLITGAEEFAMAGARAWVAAGRAQGDFINFDGLDSCGKYRITRHGRRGGATGDRSAKVAVALAVALAEARGELARRGLPAGVLVDGVVLQKGGMGGATVSRGGWSTLRVVHTSADSAERVEIGSALIAGESAARAVEALLS
ncbi:MAG: M28 family peptidase [Gemmatimonadota bacterium]|nr:MAG: M28 family peptidase [Gemmatimonadota bacterium]